MTYEPIKGLVIGRMLAPSCKDDYGTLQDKRVLNGIKLRILNGIIVKVLIRKKQECQRERRSYDDGSRGWSDIL